MQPNTIRLTKFDYPDHGWLAIDEETAKRFDLSLEDFTNYSLQGIHEGQCFMYLEEDCDMMLGLHKILSTNDSITVELNSIDSNQVSEFGGGVRNLPNNDKGDNSILDSEEFKQALKAFRGGVYENRIKEIQPPSQEIQHG